MSKVMETRTSSLIDTQWWKRGHESVFCRKPIRAILETERIYLSCPTLLYEA